MNRVYINRPHILLRQKLVNAGVLVQILSALIMFANISLLAQPETGIHPSYKIFDAKPSAFEAVGGWGGGDFFDDGTMAACSWGGVNREEGKLYILSNLTAENPNDIVVTEIASGLEEPMGLRIVEGEIYVMEQMKLVKFTLPSSTSDWVKSTVAEGWTHVNDSWAHSLEYHEGSFYTLLNDWNVTNDKLHGCWLKMETNGDIECLAGGLRSANGTALGPKGTMFTTDQQGQWLPSNKLIHLKEGHYYGHNKNTGNTFFSETITPPTAWIPYGQHISQSPSDPIHVKEGLFKDQLLIGDIRNAYIRRYFLDEVDGEYQAAVFRFIDGIPDVGGIQSGVNRLRWGPNGNLYIFGVGDHGLGGGGGNWKWNPGTNDGLQKLVFQNDTTFEMLALRSRQGGLEIEFTRPLKEGLSAENFKVQTWNYTPTSNYGGPPTNKKDLVVNEVVYSEDRYSIFLPLEGMIEEYVVHINTINVLDEQSDELWGKDVWYTQNKFSDSEPFTKPFVIAKDPGNKGTESFIRTQDGFQLNVQSPVRYSILNLKGHVLKHGATKSGRVNISTKELVKGVYLLKWGDFQTRKFIQGL